MRIISGTAGGIPIQVPKTLLRPTADRVREAVFSMLGDRTREAVVLDLFAGSGAYGLECLSRGASKCTFVEADRVAGPVISANLRKAGLAGGEVAIAPVESWMAGRRATYDLIFADPPFAKRREDRDWDGWLLESPALAGMVTPGGLFVVESFAKSAQPPPPDSPWTCEVERRYGDVLIRLFSLTSADCDAVAPGASDL